MKYIITETQAEKIKILRRIYSEDWNWISQIVDDLVNMFNPCNYESEEDYLDSVSRTTANTYLVSYLGSEEGSDTFLSLSDYIKLLIKQRMGDDIMEYYGDLINDCEN